MIVFIARIEWIHIDGVNIEVFDSKEKAEKWINEKIAKERSEDYNCKAHCFIHELEVK